MDSRIARLYVKVFSTPQESPEREQAISALSGVDRAAVFELDRSFMKGNVTRKEIMEAAKGGNGNMTYETFKRKSDSDEKGVMQELSKFAMENPSLYAEYREKYQNERMEEFRLHNRKLTENTFKSKPVSVR